MAHFFILFFFWSPGTTPDAKIRLWTLSPRFSAVLPHPEPTIPFYDWSAVSPPKTRDFRFPEPAIPFFLTGQRFPILKHVTSGCLSPRSLFPTGLQFPLPKHVTSGSHDVISGHVTSP